MSRESYVRGFSKVANAHGFNPQSLANYIYASEMCKAAGWLQNWMTKNYSKQSDDYRRSLGLKPLDRSNAIPTPGVYPIGSLGKPQPQPKPKPNDLINVSHRYSDSYKLGSLAKPKFYHGGRVAVK